MLHTKWLLQGAVLEYLLNLTASLVAPWTLDRVQGVHSGQGARGGHWTGCMGRTLDRVQGADMVQMGRKAEALTPNKSTLAQRLPNTDSNTHTHTHTLLTNTLKNTHYHTEKHSHKLTFTYFRRVALSQLHLNRPKN